MTTDHQPNGSSAYGQTTDPVPTVGGVGMAIFAGMLIVGAAVAMRRRVPTTQ